MSTGDRVVIHSDDICNGLVGEIETFNYIKYVDQDGVEFGRVLTSIEVRFAPPLSPTVIRFKPNEVIPEVKAIERALVR